MSAHNRVMFVDDEEGVRLSGDRVLSELGFQVTTAVDGEEAISELQDHPVDVVVADLRMPTVDGLELLEWLQGEQPETRFILLTGYGSDEVERKARELGAYGYLNKPISPDTLAAVVTAAAHLDLLPDMVPEAVPEAEPVPVEAVPDPVVEVEERSRLRGALRIVGGLIAAPLMGLAFVIFLPIIGFFAFFWMLGQTIWSALRPSGSGA